MAPRESPQGHAFPLALAAGCRGRKWRRASVSNRIRLSPNELLSRQPQHACLVYPPNTMTMMVARKDSNLRRCLTYSRDASRFGARLVLRAFSPFITWIPLLPTELRAIAIWSSRWESNPPHLRTDQSLCGRQRQPCSQDDWREPLGKPASLAALRPPVSGPL